MGEQRTDTSGGRLLLTWMRELETCKSGSLLNGPPVDEGQTGEYPSKGAGVCMESRNQNVREADSGTLESQQNQVPEHPGGSVGQQRPQALWSMWAVGV